MKTSIINAMSNKEVKVITVKQAKKQINTFGIPLVFFFLLMCVINFFSSNIFKLLPSDLDQDYVILIALIILTLLFTFIILINARIQLHLNFKDYWKMPKISPKKEFSYIILGLGIMLLTTSFSSLFSNFFMNTSYKQFSFFGDFKTTNTTIKNLIYFFYFILLKPITDEIIFRGIVQRQLGHYGRYFGVLGSAFLFALLQGNLVNAIPAFFIGWYLALIALKYHSIRITVMSTCTIYLFDWLINIIPNNLILLSALLILIVYILCVVILINKTLEYKTLGSDATDNRLWKIYLTSPSILIICILFIISQILYICM